MNKLEQVFTRGKAFIPFITAGDPSLETTEELVLAMAKAGADLIELGIPFSDPVAEGPIIQRATLRALANGTTIHGIFEMMERIRKKSEVPIAFMTYANPIFAYNPDEFLKECARVDVSALIVPDIPFEEKEELVPYCRKHGVNLISMVAPTSKERIYKIAREAQGFIYCVSSMGVTGTRDKISGYAQKMINLIRQVSDIPCAVGFGISNPAQAAAMSEFSQGVIVGSAIVKIIEEYGDKSIPHVVEFVQKMKNAL